MPFGQGIGMLVRIGTNSLAKGYDGESVSRHTSSFRGLLIKGAGVLS